MTKLRKAHYKQMLKYAEETEEIVEAYCYVNARLFKKRHAEIILFLNEKIAEDEKSLTDSFKNRDGL